MLRKLVVHLDRSRPLYVYLSWYVKKVEGEAEGYLWKNLSYMPLRMLNTLNSYFA